MTELNTVRWRGNTDPLVISAVGRRARRALIALVFLLVAFLLGALFLQVLVSPLSLPRSHFVFLSGDRGTPLPSHLRFAGQPFAQQEQQAWQDLATRFVADDPPFLVTAQQWQTREDVHLLGDAIRKRASQRRDLVLTYVTAHGFVSENTAYLRWHFGGSNPRTDEVRFQELIARLCEGRKSTKVLFLDFGGWPVDARDHLAVNQFFRVAQQELNRIRDPHLWVFLSHSEQEISHLMPPLKRSLFSYYVTEGLSGRANLNGDDNIDLQELAHFVTSSVSESVQQWSHGAETQTPVLLKAHSNSAADNIWPVLVPANPLMKPTADDQTTAQSGAQSGDSGQAAPASKGTPVSANPEASTKGGATAPEAPSATTGDGSVSSTGQPTSETNTAGTKAAVNSSTAPAGSATSSNAAPAPSAAGGASSGGLVPATSANTASNDAASNSEPGSGVRSTGNPSSQSSTSPGEGKTSQSMVSATGSLAEAGENSSTTVTDGTMAPTVPMPASRTSSMQSTYSTPWDYAWAVRDFAWQGYPSESRILDVAPHLWREFETELVEWEQSTPLFARNDPQRWPPEMTLAAQDLEALTNLGVDQISRFVPKSILGRRLVRWLTNEIPTIASGSLGLTRVLGRLQLKSSDPAILNFCQDFVTAASASTPQPLNELLQKAPAGVEKFVEVRIAQRCLSVDPPISWGLQQQLIQTSLRAETLAANSLGVVPWVRDSGNEGDRLRLQAERLVFDNVASDRAARAAALLEQAQKHYLRAERDMKFAQQVISARNELMYRSPDYLRWWYLAQLRNSNSGPDAAELSRLYTQVAQLNQWIEKRAPDSSGEMVPVMRSVLRQQRQLMSQVNQFPVYTLHFGKQYPGGVVALATVNGTALPMFQTRRQLNEIAPALLRECWDRVQIASPSDSLDSLPPPRLTWTPPRILELIRLQVGLAELASLNLTGTDQPLMNLQQFVQAVEKSTPKSDTSPEEIGKAFEQYRAFQQEFERYIWTRMSELAKTIRRNVQSSIQNPTASFAQLANARRALLVARPSDLDSLESTRLPAAIQNSAWHELLGWLHERALAAALGAAPQEAQFELSRARTYELDSHSIPGVTILSSPVPNLIQLTTTDNIDLVTETQRSIKLQLQNLSTKTSDVWLILDYDPHLIDVDIPGDFRILREPSLPFTTNLLSDVPHSTSPTLRLTPGQAQTVELSIRKLAATPGNSLLIVKAVTSNGISRLDIPLMLPDPELVELLVDGLPNSWTPQQDGVSLHPFPNRTTEFTLSVRNNSARDRKLQFTLLTVPPHAEMPVPLPTDAYPEALVEQWLDEWGEFTVTDGMTTEIGMARQSTVPLLFASPTTPAAPAADATPAAAAATASPATSRPTPPSLSIPAGAPLSRGALLKVTDAATKMTSLKRIDVTPQHPRRYVTVTVAYDANRERATMIVSAVDPRALPADPVNVNVDFAEPLPPESNVRLAGQLSEERPALELFADVPRGATPRLMSITVDQFPRAFLYALPCDATRLDIQERRSPLHVRIDGPTEGSIYAGSTSMIPVQLDADVPQDSILQGKATLEFGIDLNQNRILDEGDTSRILTSDRDIIVTLGQVRPGGIWSWNTLVTDLNFEFPLQGFQNSRRNLLAQLTYGEHRVWSRPVEIVVDGQPPRLRSAVALPPDQTSIEGQVQVSVHADDFGLSGVAQVQIGWDADRSGTLNAAPPPIPATQDENGAWSAMLPAKAVLPGTYSIVARATDRVGNQADHVLLKYRVLSKAEAAAMEAATTGVISGTVIYGGMPQNEIQVAVLKDGKPVVPVAKTDSNGIFRVPDVPQGTYQVAVEGIVRNKRRKFQTEVKIDKQSGLNPFLNVVLK